MAVTPITTALNHVAMSMPMEELDRASDEILAFYGELFGWTGYRDVDADGSPLIMLLGDGSQFVFVYGERESTGARPMDHYGIRLDSERDLDLVLGRARHLQSRDPRVQIVDKDETPAGDLDVVNAYVRFVLPLMVEMQVFRPRT